MSKLISERINQLAALDERRQTLLSELKTLNYQFNEVRDHVYAELPETAAKHYVAENGAAVFIESLRPAFDGIKRPRVLRIFQVGEAPIMVGRHDR